MSNKFKVPNREDYITNNVKLLITFIFSGKANGVGEIGYYNFRNPISSIMLFVSDIPNFTETAIKRTIEELEKSGWEVEYKNTEEEHFIQITNM